MKLQIHCLSRRNTFLVYDLIHIKIQINMVFLCLDGFDVICSMLVSFRVWGRKTTTYPQSQSWKVFVGHFELVLLNRGTRFNDHFNHLWASEILIYKIFCQHIHTWLSKVNCLKYLINSPTAIFIYVANFSKLSIILAWYSWTRLLLVFR